MKNKTNEPIGLTCLGAGTFPLDNLMRKCADGTVETINQHVGGTAGNVMSILAWMGWHTLPAARLDDSEYGLQIKAQSHLHRPLPSRWSLCKPPLFDNQTGSCTFRVTGADARCVLL